MSRAEIQGLLQPQIRKSAFAWNFMVWLYLAVIALTLVCQGMNIYAFRSDPVMLAVGILLTLLTLGFLAYGIHLLQDLAVIERGDESLVAKLRHRLNFQRTKYQLWLWMIALTVAILSFAVSTLADAEGGPYRINRPAVFLGFVIGQILMMYGILRLGYHVMARESQAILDDLEAQVTTNTDRIQVLRKTWFLWGLLLAVLGTILLVWGTCRSLG